MESKETLEEVARVSFNLGYDKGVKWQQDKLCNSEVIQRIRASKSDAEARRIIRTI